MKRLILGVAVVLSLALAACGNGGSSETKAKAEPKPATIPSDAITQLVDDMKSRDNVKDVSFDVNGDKITMKLVVDNVSDKQKAQSDADSFLRSISQYTDNKATSDSYGKIYKGYYVDITVEDGSGMVVVEGKKLAGYDSFDWE